MEQSCPCRSLRCMEIAVKAGCPNFMAAAAPARAKQLYDYFNHELRNSGLTVETGVFGAMMDVSLTNWGPVTLILDSRG